MEWHQPPKKQVDAVPLKEVDFVKASHGKKRMRGNLSVAKSKFEPRAVKQCQLDATAKDRLLDDVRKVFPESLLFHFWENNSNCLQGQGCSASTTDKQLQQDEPDFTFDELILANEEKTSISHEKPTFTFTSFQRGAASIFEKKSVADDSTLDLVVQRTRHQTSCKLWQELHKGRITS